MHARREREFPRGTGGGGLCVMKIAPLPLMWKKPARKKARPRTPVTCSVPGGAPCRAWQNSASVGSPSRQGEPACMGSHRTHTCRAALRRANHACISALSCRNVDSMRYRVIGLLLIAAAGQHLPALSTSSRCRACWCHACRHAQCCGPLGQNPARNLMQLALHKTS